MLKSGKPDHMTARSGSINSSRRSFLKESALFASVSVVAGIELNLNMAFAQRGASATGGAVDLGSGDIGVLIYLDESTRVGHLRLYLPPSEPPRCALLHTEKALLRGAARLAFEVFGARAVQVQETYPNRGDYTAAGFSAAGDGWWVQDRERYALREGLLQPPVPARQRRLRHPQSWSGWAKGRRSDAK